METTELSPAELAMAQIVDLYRGGYVNLGEAHALAEKHARGVAPLVYWLQGQSVQQKE
jgi:hypothetical protein